MREFIVDLRSVDEEDGDRLSDNGIVQKLEGVLLDNAGKIVRIKITTVSRKIYIEYLLGGNNPLDGEPIH